MWFPRKEKQTTPKNPVKKQNHNKVVGKSQKRERERETKGSMSEA